MMISARPVTPAGTMALREGRLNRGTAQEPGAMAWPSERDTLAGHPRRRTKLLLGRAAGGPTWIDRAACEAGSARMVGATTIRGPSLCAAAQSPVAAAKAMVSIKAAARSPAEK